MNIKGMKLKGKLLVVLALFLATVLKAQNNDDRVLFSIDNTPVTVNEFKYIYEKNNAGDTTLYSKNSLDEYLDLYVNFKLKVKEAKDLGMDTTGKFIKEFTNYRNQLAQPYLTDRQVTRELIDEAYERLKYELRVSHILLMLSPDAAPKDTMEVYNQAMQLRERVLKGEEFQVLARENSKDPSVANNGGDLGYFTAFHMIYPFESAAYSLKNINDISMPVRTRFGYHIIKLTGRRPNRGETKVRHILITTSDNDNGEERALAKAKIDSLYSLLEQGTTFEALAKQYSEHQSKNMGGELPPFTSFSNYPEEFKDAAFALKNDGDYTAPFKSSFGWHLVQRISHTGMQSKQEMEDYLKQRIAKDTRSEKSQEAAITNFKQELNFKERNNNLKKFAKLTDTTLLHGTWKLADDSKASSSWMFRIEDKVYTQKDFANYLQKKQQAGRYSDLNYALKQYYKQFINESVFTYQDEHLEEKYPEFRNIVKEYREGIILFDITDEKVWSKAIDDTTGLKEFFAKNRDKYRWEERADALIIDLRDKEAVKGIRASLEKGNSIEAIAESYKKDPLSFNYKKGLFEKKDMPVLEQVKWAPGVYDIGLMDGRYYVIMINDIKPAANKELSEVKGVVIADYQEHLEKQWIQNLKDKYRVSINKEVLSSITK